MRLILALMLAGCASGSMKAAMGPRALATTWIGLSADGSTWYRLELDDEGTGACATCANAVTTLYRARWSAEGEMTVHLEVVDGPPDAARLLDLRGTSEAWRLDLVVEGRHSVTLWREPDLVAARDRLRERMAPPRG